jgi:hypothetical protein
MHTLCKKINIIIINIIIIYKGWSKSYFHELLTPCESLGGRFYIIHHTLLFWPKKTIGCLHHWKRFLWAVNSIPILRFWKHGHTILPRRHQWNGVPVGCNSVRGDYMKWLSCGTLLNMWYIDFMYDLRELNLWKKLSEPSSWRWLSEQ